MNNVLLLLLALGGNGCCDGGGRAQCLTSVLADLSMCSVRLMVHTFVLLVV